MLREIQGSLWLIVMGVVLLVVSDDPAISFLGIMIIFSVILGVVLRMYMIQRLRRRYAGGRYQQVGQHDMIDGNMAAPAGGPGSAVYPAEMLQFISPTHLRLAMMDRDFTPNGIYRQMLSMGSHDIACHQGFEA